MCGWVGEWGGVVVLVHMPISVSSLAKLEQYYRFVEILKYYKKSFEHSLS